MLALLVEDAPINRIAMIAGGRLVSDRDDYLAQQSEDRGHCAECSLADNECNDGGTTSTCDDVLLGGR